MSQGLNGIPVLTETAALQATVAEFKALDMSTGDVPAAGGRADGIIQAGGVSGDAVAIVTLGTSTAIAGGVISAGARVVVGSTGKLIAQTAAASVKQALIAGGSAGNFTVTGIAADDVLISVFEQDGTSGILTDLTSEFSITAANTINNTGGTATTSDKLLVTYRDVSTPVVVGIARTAAAADGDEFIVALIQNA